MEMAQWDDDRLLHPIVLLSNRQQVPQMINAKCQLFRGRAIIEIASKRKREREGEWQRRQWGLHKEMDGAGPFS